MIKEVIKIGLSNNVAKCELEGQRERGVAGIRQNMIFFLAFRNSKYFAAWLISNLPDTLYITSVFRVFTVYFSCGFV